MSRIGNRELTILDGVEVKEENGLVTVKGPKGELSMKLAKEIKMEVKDGKITLTKTSETDEANMLHGTMNANLNNLIKGVKEGFKKELEIKVEEIEQEQSVQFDEDKSTFLTSLKKFINELTCIIFCLLINMNAGLDNQYYTDAYNEIINFIAVR